MRVIKKQTNKTTKNDNTIIIIIIIVIIIIIINNLHREAHNVFSRKSSLRLNNIKITYK